MARIPLRWRLAAVSLGLLGLLMTALGLLTSFYEQHTMFANQASALYNEAHIVVRPGSRFGDISLVQPGTTPPPVAQGALPLALFAEVDVLSHRLAGPGTAVVVYTTDGTILPAPPPTDESAQAPVPAYVSAQEVQAAATSRHDTSWYMLGTSATDQRQLITLMPITSGGTTVMVLELASPTAPIDSTVTATQAMLLLGVVAALAIGLLATPPLVRAALKPLREMERATSRISSGDLTQRLEVPQTQDEIGRLARSFNNMVARLEAAFGRQKRFVADVSHELRTPLTALGGGMEMLMIGAQAGDPEVSARLMRGMYAEVERMRRLVEDLLTLTRLDEGRMQLRMERLAPGALVSSVAEQAERLTRGQVIRADVEPTLPEIQVDADRMRQVLLNLVDNALKFTPAPGAVTLAARREGKDAVAMEVRDTGAGIAPDALPHVFERFYRADPARARAHGQVGGSGLGLSIAKSLVEACGGRIAISSEVGEGTRVILRFPVAAATGIGQPVMTRV
jgi:two-component system OmpR family sensor kinase